MYYESLIPTPRMDARLGCPAPSLAFRNPGLHPEAILVTA